MVEVNGFILYAFFIPIMLLVGIPLIAFIVWYIGRSLQLFNTTHSGNHSGNSQLEKRRSRRVKVDRVYALVSDNLGPVVGKVRDLSQTGMCITGLPKEAAKNSKQLFVEIATSVQIIQMPISKKWEAPQDNLKNIGVAIENAPLEWHEFVVMHYHKLSF